MIFYTSDHYYLLGQPILTALEASPYTTTELKNLFKVKFFGRKVRFENVLAWLEDHGHIRWADNLWHLRTRINLAVLAKGLGYEYGVTVEEMRGIQPFGPHVKARAHLASYANQHGWTFDEIGSFLCLPTKLVKNAAERHRELAVA